MPTNHLRWTEIRKFGGLHDADVPALMPANTARVMSGCHPMPNGGLRAFFKPRPWGTTSGLARSGNPALRLVAVYPTEGQAFCVTAPADTTVTTDAVRPPSGEAKAYVTSRLSQTWGAAVTGITAGRTTTGLFFPVYGQTGGILTPQQNDGRIYTVIQQLDSENGVYSMSEADDTFRPESTIAGGANFSFITEYQNRLVGAYESSVVFTTPGTADFPTAGSDPDQFINLGDTPVAWILPLPPSDLFVGLRDGAVFSIQGALDDPTTRLLRTAGTGGNAAGLNQVAAALSTERGPIAVDPSRGPFLIYADGGVVPLGPGMGDDHWRTYRRSTGSEGGYTMAYADGFLFVRSDGLYQNELDRRIRFLTAGSPDGTIFGTAHEGGEVWPTDMAAWVEANELHLNGLLAYDFASGAWFRTAHPDVADWPMPWHVAYNEVQEGFYEQGTIIGIPTEEFTGATATRLGYGHQFYGPRQHTWEWASAPLRGESGRQISLKEVELGAYGHTRTGIAEGTSTITVTAENEHGETDTDTVVIQPGASQVVRAQLNVTGTYVTVSLKAVSSDASEVEAPTLEYVRFGSHELKTVYQKD